MQMRKYMGGVTLLELMVVVVIIGILTAIAFPNYREFVARAKRAEAKAALLKIATNQEKFYLQNQTFSDDLSKLGYSGTAPFKSETGAYALTVAPNPTWPQGFIATATYIPDDAEKGKCTSFSIDGGGSKTNTGSYSDCWTRKN
jgi:type IV pilus assembly protein PilE